jgi:sortase A
VDPLRPSRAARSRRRRTFRAVGNALLAFGVLVGLFTAYELWGTGLITARAQSQLRDEVALHGFADYFLASEGNQRPQPIPGNALGFIKIPKIGLDMVFVEGISLDDLRKGPGHYPESALPGQPGNVAIAGHRTTYLHPFWSLNELVPGDKVILRTRRGSFTYRIEWVRVVGPKDWTVVAPTSEPSVTLTTCEPRFSAAQRLIARGVLVKSAKKG